MKRKGEDNGITTQDNCDLLSTRVSSKLSDYERSQFEDALLIYPVGKQVMDYNLFALEKLRNPMVVLSAKQNCAAAAKLHRY